MPLGAGLALAAGFVVHALRRGTSAIVDLRLFRHRAFATSAALLALSGLSLYGAMLLLPLYEQIVGGHDALAAGLLLAPQGVGSLLARPAGPLTDRLGPRPIALAGMALAAAGTLPYALAGPQTSGVLLGASLVVRGLGLSAANIAILPAAFQGLERPSIPHAGMTTRILQYLGGSFGTAVLATLLAGQMATHPATVGGRAAAFDVTFWWALGFTLLAMIPAALLPPRSPGPK